MPRAAAKPARAPRKRAPAKRPAYSAGRLRGHGDYTYDQPGPWGRIGRSLGEHAGGMIGGQYGLGKAASKIGGKLGSYAHYIGKLFGSGDYITSADEVKANTVMNQAQVPSFGHGKNVIKVRHREFLGDVISSATIGAFAVKEYAINPGLAQSLPWLSQVCGSSFQQYRINGMVFEFRSMSADALNSTNTALGSVIMATDYDSKDGSFTSKQQMENTEFGVSCKPSSCMIHGIECARNQTSVSELYIRAFGVPSGADIRLYDMGRFSIATVGMQAASVNLGELWVSYDIDLFKAIDKEPGYLAQVAEFTLVNANINSTSALGLSTITSSPTVVVDQIGLTLRRTSGTDTVVFPVDMPIGSKFVVNYGILGSSTASVAYQAITLSGGLVALASDTANPNFTQSTLTTSSKQRMLVFVYNGGTQAAPPTLAFTGGVVPTAISLATLSISLVGSAYVADGW